MQPEPDYLQPTDFCDFHHPMIGRYLQKIINSASSDREKAIAIFHFVREKIRYRFNYPGTPASVTLTGGSGNCFNKANLQIAFLRRAGIPSAYGVCLIHREVFQPLLPEDIYHLVNEPTVHVYACCWLDEHWVAADATIDRHLYETFYRGQPGWDYTDWDGRTDYLLPARYLIAHQGFYASIDLYLLNPPRFWTDQLLTRANNFLEDCLRKGKFQPKG